MSEVVEQKWPADNIERWPVDKLIGYARNSRKHSDAQVEMIAASMKEWGWTNPCLVDEDGMIIAGHGRVMASKKLGFAEVPVMVARGWTEAQKRAYVIADNQLAMAATWDDDMLKVELSGLKLEGFDMELLGFGDALTDLLDPDMTAPPGKDPDAVPATPETPHSVLGDMWVCGPHRVRCGSSTEMGDWSALMGSELADIQVCDPPYNVAYESKLAGKIKNDDMKDGEFYQFLLDFYTCSFAVMKPGAAMYVAHADSEGANFRGALKKSGFNLKSCLMWVKNSLVLGRGDFHYRHEPILYATKPGGTRRWFGGRKQTTLQEFGAVDPIQRLEDGRYAVVSGDSVFYLAADAVVEEVPSTLLHVPKPKRSAMHPTMKPVALWERLAKNNARNNDIIIDGFGGSGTTMIAAERMGMCARLMEFDPKFVDVICVRYFQYTGRVPVHAETGEPFPQEVIDRLSAGWEAK